jgi:hypothetical protein
MQNINISPLCAYAISDLTLASGGGEIPKVYVAPGLVCIMETCMQRILRFTDLNVNPDIGLHRKVNVADRAEVRFACFIGEASIYNRE